VQGLGAAAFADDPRLGGELGKVDLLLAGEGVAGGGAGERGELCLGGGQLGGDRVGAGNQGVTGVGERDAAAVADDQPGTGLGFQAVDVVADRGLAVAEGAGGGGDRAVLRDRRSMSSRRTSSMAFIVTRCGPAGHLKTASSHGKQTGRCRPPAGRVPPESYRSMPGPSGAQPAERTGRMDETTTARPGLGSQVWHFARHWLEMCVVMCVGGASLNGLLFMAGPALFGYPDLRERSPVVAVLLSGLIYALPMAGDACAGHGVAAHRGDVRRRGCPGRRDHRDGVGRRCLRQGPARLGDGLCGPACAVMFVVMLLRLDLYTGRTGHGMKPPHPRPHVPAAYERSASAAAGVALTIANAARRQPARI
jgi:hypothetical protein